MVWLLGNATRFDVRGWEHYRRARQRGPVIHCFWHNQLLLATYFWRRSDIAALTSRHLDGEFVSRVICRFGNWAVRGSSSRGGARALLQLKRHVEKGLNVAFAADGPRGPRYRVKAGPVWLAQKTGLRVLPFHIEPRHFREMDTWDAFRIPRPFTSAVVQIGPPVLLTGVSSAEGLRLLQEGMDRTSRAARKAEPEPKQEKK